MIIVLCGVAGSGKDTIADILAEKHGFHKESFAAPLKKMLKLAYPDFDDEDLYGPSANRNCQYMQYPITCCPFCGGGLIRGGIDKLRYCDEDNTHDNIPDGLTPRIALQTLGTEWGRRLYIDTWVDACFNRMEPGLDYAVTDGRFHHEVLRSNALGAITVRLSRGSAGSTSTHASESEFSKIPKRDFGLVFDNENVDLEELPAKVETLYTAATCYRRA